MTYISYTILAAIILFAVSRAVKSIRAITKIDKEIKALGKENAETEGRIRKAKEQLKELFEKGVKNEKLQKEFYLGEAIRYSGKISDFVGQTKGDFIDVN